MISLWWPFGSKTTDTLLHHEGRLGGLEKSVETLRADQKAHLSMAIGRMDAFQKTLEDHAAQDLEHQKRMETQLTQLAKLVKPGPLVTIHRVLQVIALVIGLAIVMVAIVRPELRPLIFKLLEGSMKAL